MRGHIQSRFPEDASHGGNWLLLFISLVISFYIHYYMYVMFVAVIVVVFLALVL